MWYVGTVESTSAMRKKEIPLFATTWMNLEDMSVSEKETEKDKYCVIYHVS